MKTPHVRTTPQGVLLITLPGIGELTLPVDAPATLLRAQTTGRPQPIDALWTADAPEKLSAPAVAPLDVQPGDWVRRYASAEDRASQGILCRVVSVGDGMATLQPVDDPEDETVNGPWDFKVANP